MRETIKIKLKKRVNQNLKMNHFNIQLKQFISIFIYILLLNLMLSTIFSFNAISSNQNYPTNIKVNKDSITSSFPAFSMAIDDDGIIYIIWNDKLNDDDRYNNMFISKSIDGGWTFTEPIQINDDDGSVPQAAYASISANENGNVYIVWTDGRIEGGGIGDIYFDKSTDGGETFGNDLKVNDNSKRGDDVTPSVAADSYGNAYVVWEDCRNDAGDVYFSKLSVGNSTFSANICVNDDPGAHQQSGAAMTIDDNGSIYVAWSDLRDYGGIYFSKSTDGGKSFNKDVKVCAISPDFESIKIAAYLDNVYITWHDEAEKNVYFVKSENNGISWSGVKNLEGNIRSTWKSAPSIAIDNLGKIYVTWSEIVNDNYEIIIAQSKNNGEDWDFSTNKDINTKKAHYVIVITDNNNDPYLSWVEFGSKGTWDIYFLKINPSSLQNVNNTQFNIFLLGLIVVFIIILVSLPAYAATELGKISLIKFFSAPFYSKIDSKDVLKHNIRVQILRHITSYPGNNFNSIQRTLQIGNGTLVYHLTVLERENYISSKKDGFYKRFYPKNFQMNKFETGIMIRERDDIMDDSNGRISKNIANNCDIQERILRTIQTHPGITQKELGELLDHSTTGINYHINIMANAKIIRVDRDGKWTRCYISDDN